MSINFVTTYLLLGEFSLLTRAVCGLTAIANVARYLLILFTSTWRRAGVWYVVSLETATPEQVKQSVCFLPLFTLYFDH